MWQWILSLFKGKKNVQIIGRPSGWTVNHPPGKVNTEISKGFSRGGFGTGKFGN